MRQPGTSRVLSAALIGHAATCQAELLSAVSRKRPSAAHGANFRSIARGVALGKTISQAGVAIPSLRLASSHRNSPQPNRTRCRHPLAAEPRVISCSGVTRRPATRDPHPLWLSNVLGIVAAGEAAWTLPGRYENFLPPRHPARCFSAPAGFRAALSSWHHGLAASDSTPEPPSRACPLELTAPGGPAGRP